MCSTKDTKQRCIKGNIAFNSFKAVWLEGRRIPLPKLIIIYEAMVVSVIMYNCSSWAASKEVLNKLDVCHRKHLRQLLNIKYPTTITNVKLYEKCNTTPLSHRVKKSRWRMFGHILRSPENSPAALSLHFAVSQLSELKGRRGRHRINLLSVLRDDLNRIPIDLTSTKPTRHNKLSLKSTSDITILRDIASDRREWSFLYNYLV